MLLNFNSIPELLNASESYHGQNDNARDDSYGDGWYGDGTWESTKQLALTGDNTLVPEAEKLLTQIVANIELPVYRWLPSPAGAFPVIPDYLGNSPTPMRIRRRVTSSVAPVRLYVSTTLSANLNQETQNKRGIAILALVMLLQRVRPVEFYFLSETHGSDETGSCIIATKLETQPLDLAVACHCLTHVSFPRRFNYHLSRKYGFNGHWPTKYSANHEHREALNPTSPYALWLRSYVGMSPEDIYIKPTHVDQPIVRKPITWINSVLAELNVK